MCEVHPVTAVQSKSGTYARLHLHGETGRFSAGGMVHGFQQKGGVFEGGSPCNFTIQGTGHNLWPDVGAESQKIPLSTLNQIKLLHNPQIPKACTET